MHKSKPLDFSHEWDNKFAEEYEYTPLIITEEIGEYTMPSEILLYDPTEDDIFTRFHVGSSNEFRLRQIFLHVELLKHEEEMLLELDSFLAENCIKLPGFMSPLVLRVLMFNKRRHPNTYIQRSMNHLITMFNWRVSTYPLSDIESSLREDLESGIIYWHGRDYCLRPILTIRLSKVNKHFPLDRFIRLIVFCMEWGMRYLMCPGKVETCLALIDIKGVSLTSFPISTMSEISSLLTNQYSFRLYRMFILHDSLFIQTVWSLMKQFLTDLQQHKIILSRHEIKSQLFKTVHPNQVEEHFGGLQKNRTVPFYPFSFPPGPFSDPKLHPNNGFTRVASKCDPATMGNFSKVTRCHLLFNKFNVLGKLLYKNNPYNRIVWDKQGLEELKDVAFSLLGVDLQDGVDSTAHPDYLKNPNGTSDAAISSDPLIDDKEWGRMGSACSTQRFNICDDDVEQTEMSELKSCLEKSKGTAVTASPAAQKKASLKSRERTSSAEINIGIINTININAEIANIGDYSQHFIKEYSVLSESSPSLTENIAMIIGDSQSFFSGSSSFYVNEDSEDNQRQRIEDLHNNLLMDNPCYDSGIFQSFGVLPLTMDIFRQSGKKNKKSSMSSSKEEHAACENSCSSNVSNARNSQFSRMVSSNSDTTSNNKTPNLGENDSKEVPDKTCSFKKSSHDGDHAHYNRDQTLTTKKPSLTLSPPNNDMNPPVSSLNTSSSCKSSMENTKLNGRSFIYISKTHERPRISRRSRIKSRISKVINRIKNASRTSIVESS